MRMMRRLLQMSGGVEVERWLLAQRRLLAICLLACMDGSYSAKAGVGAHSTISVPYVSCFFISLMKYLFLSLSYPIAGQRFVPRPTCCSIGVGFLFELVSRK